MEARVGTWFEVANQHAQGLPTFIRDLSGRAWRVEFLYPPPVGFVHLVGGDGQKAKWPLPFDSMRPVTILEVTQEEATAVLQAVLGAQIMGESWNGSILVCPPVNTNLAAHLSMIHGIYVDDVNNSTKLDDGAKKKSLRDAHAASHANPDLQYVIPHTHREK